MRLPCLATLVVAVLLMTAGSAHAQSRCQGGPGNSAIAQYCEAVPDATGSKPKIPSRGVKAGNGASTDAPRIPADTAQALAGQGGYGAAVLALAGQGVPKHEQGDKHPAASTPTPTRRGEAAALPPAGALHAVTAAASSGAVLGSGLIWMLLGVLALAVGLGWAGARRGG